MKMKLEIKVQNISSQSIYLDTEDYCSTKDNFFNSS